MLVDISKGELIDKITILEIKSERIEDEVKLKNINTELDILRKLEFPTTHKATLKEINEIIWDVEERVRFLEDENNFGEEFIEQARMVYKYNDERARVKRAINVESGSHIIEEKSYATKVQRSSV